MNRFLGILRFILLMSLALGITWIILTFLSFAANVLFISHQLASPYQGVFEVTIAHALFFLRFSVWVLIYWIVQREIHAYLEDSRFQLERGIRAFRHLSMLFFTSFGLHVLTLILSHLLFLRPVGVIQSAVGRNPYSNVLQSKLGLYLDSGALENLLSFFMPTTRGLTTLLLAFLCILIGKILQRNKALEDEAAFTV